MKTASLVLLLLGWLLSFAALSARAQQTVFNVPSATVTDRGYLFVQNEAQFRPWKPSPFYAGTQYQALGIGLNTEIDLTIFDISAPKSGLLTMGVGFKSAIPLLEKKLKGRELKLVVGDLVTPDLEKGGSVGNWTYAMLSARLPRLNTRLSGGISYGTHHIFGRELVKFLGSYEQPVTKKFVLQGDWYSGRHTLGLFIPGFSYALTGSTTLYCGFQIPNFNDNGKTGFVVELAQILPLKFWKKK